MPFGFLPPFGGFVAPPPGARLAPVLGRGAGNHDVRTTPHDVLGLAGDDLLAMYRTMVTSRLLDEAALRQNRQGRAPFVVPAEGHEACQVGTAWPMRKGHDVWLPYYRDLAVVLTAGMTPYEIFLGVFAKADDPSSGGRQMPSHWGHRALGIISGSSPIATQVPHAAGIAYAMKYRHEDAVVGCWFGDGATSEGDWHEGLNFAAIHRLPVVFICENNHYAISVPQSKQMAVENVADRASAYGMPGVVVDGNDVLACYGAMKTAHERARNGEGPTLVECKTYRFLGHTSDDDDKTYRTRDEVDEARHDDPLQRFREYLLSHGILDDAGSEAMRAEAKTVIDEAITAAWEAPDPLPASALRHVFFEEGDGA
jgi:2-oxoisovalerate dehydrogenase E1 component alpha subunit